MRSKAVVALLLALAAALAATGIASARSGKSAYIPTAPAFGPNDNVAPASMDWPVIGGNVWDQRYSTLKQITTANVHDLKIAWTHHLGFKPVPGESQEGNAIEYHGVLYIATGLDEVYALDAATGNQLWAYKHGLEPGAQTFLLKVNRGVAIGDGKVFVGQLDGRVVALNQQTGAVEWRTRLGLWPEGYAITAPVSYVNGKVMVGMSGGDWGARAFLAQLDPNTGKELWRWYVVPSPGELGGGSWELGGWLKGGGAIWIGSTYDPQTNLYYVVTGNPVPYNGRGPGENLFTDSIVALNFSDGTMGWWFQTVHHDLWDFDVTNPPILFDAEYNGQMRHGIAAASKTGWVYILDRTNGTPLVGITEKPVPQQTGEGATYANTWKTQPYPKGDAFVHQCSNPSMYKPLAPDGKPYKYGCIFTPYAPTSKGSYIAANPSASGGVDWPPSAYNPDRQMVYVCAQEGGGALGAIPTDQQQWVPGDVFKVVGINFGSTKIPTHGVVAAINVHTNKLVWKLANTKGGWPTPCYSGAMTTAGNLLFVGHTEQYLSAYNAGNGHELWRSPKLPGGASAPSITYEVNGKQYITIFAGGGGAAKQSDAVVTFALP